MKGNCGKTATTTGDLIVQVKVKPHPVFKRDGNNITSDLYVTLAQAILGADVQIQTMQGDVKMRLQPGTQHNQKQKLTGYGIKQIQSQEKGNHIVTVKVIIPKKLS